MNTLTTFKQKKDIQGFTLIELMIAIAIVGVLAAIAVPQFTDYLGRARVSEAVNLAQGCKTGFVEFNATRGAFPTTPEDSGCASVATDNVASIALTGGVITVNLKATNTPLPPAIRGHSIMLQPLDANGNLAASGGVIAGWNCVAMNGANRAGDIALRMVPSGCTKPIAVAAAPASS